MFAGRDTYVHLGQPITLSTSVHHGYCTTVDTATSLIGLQAHQGPCATNGRTPQDQAAAVLPPEDGATPVQIVPAGTDHHPGNGSGCPQNSEDCG